MGVVLLSGGLDSAVLLAGIVNDRIPDVDRPRNPICLAFDYGQKHRTEVWHSYQVAHYYGCRWQSMDIPPAILAGSALTGAGAIPHGHYADPVQSATVVSNRNLVLLSIAAATAVRHGLSEVLFAAHAGDAAIYPDCRPAFVEAINRAMRLACGVGVKAPFLGMSKGDIVELGRLLLVPFDMTWSCYEGRRVPCGECGACVEREEALSCPIS